MTQSRLTKVDAALLASLDRAFAKHAGGDARIDVADLKRALGLRGDYLARRVLARFDRDGDGSISREEFLSGVRTVLFGGERERLLFAFQLHDHDHDGAISREEIARMVAMTLAEAGISLRGAHSPERLAAAVMADADTNRDGHVTFPEFEASMRRRPALLRQMTRSEALWIAPSEDLLARLDAKLSTGERLRRAGRYLRNRWLPALALTLWALANTGLFAAVMLDDAHGPSDALMCLGRATGRCLDLNGALILVPVMRGLLTRLRAAWIGRALPIDDAIDFHRVAGNAMAALALVHSAAFVAARGAGHLSSPLTHFLFATGRGVTGVALVVVFAVMWALSLPVVRRTRRFELFYASHMLYAVWFVLVVAHAPTVLLWTGVPLVAWVIERVRRARRRGAKTFAVAAQAVRSGVTRLDIRRPEGFRFSPGDYVFLKVPSVARYEWHPFTLSSAPEREALTIHARVLGNWTAALRARVEAQEADPAAPPLEVYVDGPYGSPTAHLFDAEYAVMIGAGIGVTPFASVLESLVLRAREGRASKLRKGHFVWLNRDQFSFEWFADLLADLEREDRGALLDLHLYMTDGRTGATSLGLELARELSRDAGHGDIVTGLQTRTHLGAPDWPSLLGDIAKQHAPARVDVFFCGPPGLAATLQRVCARLGMTFRQERF
ncbi:MAG: EF-hand domain-containing protein [Polyangiales bacterium]